MAVHDGRGLEAKPSEPAQGRSIHPLASSLDRSLHVCERANSQGCGGAVSQRESVSQNTIVARVQLVSNVSNC